MGAERQADGAVDFFQERAILLRGVVVGDDAAAKAHWYAGLKRLLLFLDAAQPYCRRPRWRARQRMSTGTTSAATATAILAAAAAPTHFFAAAT